MSDARTPPSPPAGRRMSPMTWMVIACLVSILLLPVSMWLAH